MDQILQGKFGPRTINFLLQKTVLGPLLPPDLIFRDRTTSLASLVAETMLSYYISHHIHLMPYGLYGCMHVTWKEHVPEEEKCGYI